MVPLSRFAILLGASLLVSVGVMVVAPGCASKTESGPFCKPDSGSYCRCQNRQDGTKTCNEEGTAWGRCDPCETADNPVVSEGTGEGPREPTSVEDRDAEASRAAVCGDNVVQDGEDCDDGNKVEGDGCNATCKLSGTNPLASHACPGLDVHVWAKPVVTYGTTNGAPLTAETEVACAGSRSTRGDKAPNRIYKVTAHRSGTMSATTTEGDFDSFLYVSTACAVSPARMKALVCANDVTGVGGEKLTWPVTAGQTYTLVVDGAGVSNVQGAFTLTLAIQ